MIHSTLHSIRTAFFGVVLATSSLAFAQTPPPAPPPPPEQGAPGGDFAKVREACHDDVQRLCGDLKPGEGRIRECLHAHKDQLSDGCKTAMREAHAHHHPKN